MSSSTVSQVMDEMQLAQRKIVYLVEAHRIQCDEQALPDGTYTGSNNQLGHALTSVMQDMGRASTSTMMVLTVGRSATELQELRSCWGLINEALEGDITAKRLASEFPKLGSQLSAQIKRMAAAVILQDEQRKRIYRRRN